MFSIVGLVPSNNRRYSLFPLEFTSKAFPFTRIPAPEVATGADSTAEPASATTQVEDQWSAQWALLLSNSLTGAVGKCMFFCD